MPRQRPVPEIMTAPPITVSPDTSVEEAARLLASNSIGGAPVVDGSGRLLGLLDDTDLIVSEARLHAPTTIELFGAYLTLPGESHRYAEEVRHALAAVVRDVMDPDPPSVRIEATVEDVATLIVDRDVSRVPVLDGDGRVVGIVSRGDIVRAMASDA